MSADLIVGIGADNSGLNRGITEAQSQINSFVSKASQAGSKLASIGVGLTATVSVPLLAIGKSAVTAYSELQGVKVAFERLNDAKLLDNLRSATKSTTADIELMKAAVQSDKFGLSTSALPVLLEYAGRVAKDTGQEVDYLVNSIVTGIGRKSPLILDNLGISASQLKAELNGVSVEAASVADVTEAVGRIATQELAKMGKDTLTLSEQFLRLKASIANSMAKIGDVINKNLNLSGIIGKITDFVNKIVSGFESLSPPIQKAIVIFGAVATAIGPILVVVGGFLAVLPSIISGVGALSGVFAALTGPIGLVIVGVIAIVAAVADNWDKIKPYIINTINYFRDLYNESLVVRVAVQVLVTSFKNGFDLIAGVLKTSYELFKTFAKQTADIFGGLGSVIKGGLTLDPKEFLLGLTKINLAFAKGFDSAKKDLKKGITEAFSDVSKNTADALKNIVNNEKLKPITDIKLFDTEKVKKNTAKTLIDAVGAGIKTAGTKIAEGVTIEPIKIGKSAGLIYNGDEFDSLESMQVAIQKNADIINSAYVSIPETMSEANLSIRSNLLDLQNSFQQMSDFGNFLGDSISLAFNFVVDTIADNFSAIGEAMASGGNVFQAFGSALLGSIGSFLSDLGKQMIQYGVAALAMATLTKLLSNPITAAPAAIALIAAGAALSVIGGAIKGTLQNGGSGGGSVSSSAGASSGANYNTSYGGGNGGGEVVFRISGDELVGVLNKQNNKNKRLGG